MRPFTVVNILKGVVVRIVECRYGAEYLARLLTECSYCLRARA